MDKILFEIDDYPRNYQLALGFMDQLKSINPNFTGTVFCIPTEMKEDHWKQLEDRPWLKPALHGFYHDSDDYHFWSYVDWIKHLKRWYDPRMRKIFKGPHYSISFRGIAALREKGFIIACRTRTDLLCIPHRYRTWLKDFHLQIGVKVSFLDTPGIISWHCHTENGTVTSISNRSRKYKKCERNKEFVLTEDIAVVV